MKWHFLGLWLLFSFSHNNTRAETIPYPPMFSDAPIKRFHPTEYPQFNLIQRELLNITTRRGDPQIKNMFCASGFVFPNGDERVMVIWKNKEQLYWWDGTSDDQERQESLSLWLSPYSDLKNAVEDGAMLSGPTTVNRSQAKAAVDDCEKYGQKFLISPFTPVKEKSDEDFDVEDLKLIDDSEDSK